MHLIGIVALAVGLLVAGQLKGQNDPITLEEIWKGSTFRTKSVPDFNFLKDGEHYSRRVSGGIVKYSLVTGEATDTLLSSLDLRSAGVSENLSTYTFSEDEMSALLKTNSERIYRRSTKANFFVFDIESGELQDVFGDKKVMHATLSPDASRVAFVFESNLYVRHLGTGDVDQITSDGKYNEIINGSADWVYEEEFGFTKAFQWSPDNKKIAFYRFDESKVKEFPMEYFKGGTYPELVTFKYPKVGEMNSTVTIHIYDLDSGESLEVDQGSEPDGYIPRIKWTADPNALCVAKMNRHQNHLQLLLADAGTGVTQLMYEERNKYYVNIHDDLTFLADGEHFVTTSEKSGFNHIYLHTIDGSEVRPLTSGEWDVTAFYGLDETDRKLYYQAAKNGPQWKAVYEAEFDGGGDRILTNSEGSTSASFSTTYDYFVSNWSSINRAPTIEVVRTENKKSVRTIEDNRSAAEAQRQTGTSPVEFFSFHTSEDVELNGWMLKPAEFDESKEYPVLMYLYGGPGSQQVTDSWKGNNYWWFQMLAQQGFVVACIDNRGTGARGEEFRKMTYQKLGHYETIDQIEAAKYLGSLPFTDARRLGIFGWSYGGYMSSLCLLKGHDVFKSAIAVAPVTNWKWYDTIYTERYMRTHAENKDGYEQNSPINFVDRLEGDYLLVHGIADDNVHWQHTVEMANALIDANKQFDTYFYPNRNHGIAGGNARLHLYTKMTNFLHENLGAGAMGTSKS